VLVQGRYFAEVCSAAQAEPKAGSASREPNRELTRRRVRTEDLVHRASRSTRSFQPATRSATSQPSGVTSYSAITTHELVAELAHELQHASEVAAHPDVIDGAALRAMYRAIGYQSCNAYGIECWETREAQAAERVVREQLRRFQAFARRR
jgi:hypothetical protein